MSEFFLDGTPGRARVGVRGLLGIRVPCLGNGVTEGVLAFAVILGMVTTLFFEYARCNGSICVGSRDVEWSIYTSCEYNG